MERTFKQELDLAMEHKINVLKLNIANEVVEQLTNQYWWTEEQLANATEQSLDWLEDLCTCVYNIYLEIDNNYSLANVVEAVIELSMKFFNDFNKITKYMVIGYIQDNF